MLNRTVPTPTTSLVPPTRAGGAAFASMMKTSLSGSENGTWPFQLLVGRSSFQVPDAASNLTMSPTGGFGVWYTDSTGSGGRPWALAATTVSLMDVVRLPESRTPA